MERYEFPEFLDFRPDSRFEKRALEIRKDIENRSGIFFEVSAPWMQSNVVQRHSVDWVFSHSVLEHVDDLAGTYYAIAKWLKLKGYATHLIDFYSHNLTHEWNGHWALSEAVWSVIRGKTPYLLNRCWCDDTSDSLLKTALRLSSQSRRRQWYWIHSL